MGGLSEQSFEVFDMLNIKFSLSFFGFVNKFRVQKLRSNAWIEDPGRCGEVGDA